MSLLKPRHTNTATGGGNAVTGHTKDPEFATSDTNEKEAKIQKHDSDKCKQWLLFVLVLSMAAFLLGNKPRAPSGDVSGPQIMDAAPVEHVVPLEKEEPQQSDAQLVQAIAELDAKVRQFKQSLRVKQSLPKGKRFMETDPEGLKLTGTLQTLTRKLLVQRFDIKFPPRVVVELVFPKSIPDYSPETSTGQFVIGMAPFDLIPYSVYNFLEIARTWKSGAFHRNANHVLQVMAHSDVKQSMPFQEYSPDFPHVKGSCGYAGRPSGPAWYVSIQDNTRNHGPGSQQQLNPHEADSNFGTIIEGMDDVIPRIHSVPQTSWLDKGNHIQITKMTILIRRMDTDEWIPWEL